MIRGPPRPPLFPYTTLFRSRLDPVGGIGSHQIDAARTLHRDRAAEPFGARRGLGPDIRQQPRLDRRIGGVERLDVAAARSEEHTSELQSRENLVCRLLLEKK